MFVSWFLKDMDRIFKIFHHLLNGSSGFFPARVFPNILDFHDDEIYKVVFVQMIRDLFLYCLK